MKNIIVVLLMMILISTPACKKVAEICPDRMPDDTYNPVILPENFTESTSFTNPYFPYQQGQLYIYESETKDGLEHIEYQVVDTTRTVMGIICAVINDKVWLDGQLIEDTDDWYAQDNDGNVWYMGEWVLNYNPDGSFKGNEGSWEAGVDGAKPGYIMLANPQPEDAYRQEYLFNEAEDEGAIVELEVTIEVPYGTFNDCLWTKEWTELEPGIVQFKYYAPGIGLVRDIQDNEDLVLVDIIY